MHTSTLFSVAINILLFAISVFVVAKTFPGVRIKNFIAAIGVSIVYSFLNYIAYHILGVFSVSFGIITLGIGFWVINTILLVLTDKMIESFHIKGLFWASLASLGISVINALLIWLVMPRLYLMQLSF